MHPIQHSSVEMDNWTYCPKDLANAPDSDPAQAFHKVDETNTGTVLQPFDPQPSHVGPLGPQPAHADSFYSSITTQSTMPNSSFSGFQNAYANVGASPSIDQSISGQQVMNIDYGFHDNCNASGSIQSPFNFMSATAGTHDQHTSEFYGNCIVNQGWNQPYFSENITHSPPSIDPGALLATGDTSLQSAPNVMRSSRGSTSTFEATTQGPLNVHTIQPGRSSEPLLPKDEFGYVLPKAAWHRLCMTEPPLPTEDFDALFFPPGQAVLRNEKGEFICQVQAKVTHAGPAVWEYRNGPCDAVLQCWDSYRRHLVLCHLGCSRRKKSKLITWIVNRWFEAETH